MENPSPRERILATADRLFYAQGYHATGINQIIAEAEVAKASFYQHFPSKEDLALAYLQGRHRTIRNALERLAERPLPPRERVAALFDFLEAFVTGTQYGGCAFLNIASEFPLVDSRIRSEVEEHKHFLREQVASFVRAALPDGAADAEIKARAVYLLFEGALAESHIVRDPWPVRAAAEAALGLLA